MEEFRANVLYQKASKELSKIKLHFHTIQFLELNNKTKYTYTPYGSGVLVQIKENFLIFTASHVVENFHRKPLYINTRVGVQVVIGTCCSTDLKQQKNVYLSYIILDTMLGLLLAEDYKFLPLNKIIHSHETLKGANYMVSGYPEKDIWRNNSDIYTGSSHFLLHMASDEVFAFYGLNKKENYVLFFGGRGIDIETGEKTNKISDPYGISGCGLWYLTPTISNERIILDYYLIGIMTMFRKSKYHILIGNRVELIMNELKLN